MYKKSAWVKMQVDQRTVRVKTSQYFQPPAQLWETCGVFLDSNQYFTLHLSEQLHTLEALCSGMLVLEPTTAKIKLGKFLTCPMTESSTFPWQQ